MLVVFTTWHARMFSKVRCILMARGLFLGLGGKWVMQSLGQATTIEGGSKPPAARASRGSKKGAGEL